jgi:hypothetical protein
VDEGDRGVLVERGVLLLFVPRVFVLLPLPLTLPKPTGNLILFDVLVVGIVVVDCIVLGCIVLGCIVLDCIVLDRIGLYWIVLDRIGSG